MPEVPYNHALSNQEFYGYGVVQRRAVTLDMPPMAMTKGGIRCDKQPISYPPHEKVNKNYKNYYTDYLNESIDSLNFDERAEDQLARGLDFAENNPNENFDYDGDGRPDLDLNNYSLPNDIKSAEVADELVVENPEREEEPQQKIEEKSTIVTEAPVVEKEGELQSIEQQKPKTYETPKNELKTVTATINDKSIMSSDGILPALGGLALGLLFMSRA